MSPNCPLPPAIFPKTTSPTSKTLITTLLHSSTAPSNILSNVTTDLKHLTTSFKTRYFRSDDGRQAAVWVYQRLEGMIGGSGYGEASVRFFNHSWVQPSVIARIGGSSGSTIVLSCHLDSVNLNLPAFFKAPGANDNASGVSALLSIFQTLLLIPTTSNPHLPFKNTIEFHFYAAEESGLWGSAEVFSSYNKMYKPIHSVLTFDTIGRPPPPQSPPQKNKQIGIVADFLLPEFKQYIELLIKEYTNPNIDSVETSCGYACSDHASAVRFGYPGALLTSGRLEDVIDGKVLDYSHSGGDTMEKLDLGLIVEFVRFGVAWCVELGFAELGGNDNNGNGNNINNNEGRRAYLCDNGYPDGWMGSVRRFSAARAAEPLGIGLWVFVLIVMLGIARPWEEVPIIMKMGRRVRRRARRGYRVLVGREGED
ncbi:Leucine aminopeptidase 1 [Orbilia javanica]|uniref:Peptide hydrolase n=1 Tax=Orbilia javanica TaxID=47235 RepID=A0AAN8RFH2_9PEZI